MFSHITVGSNDMTRSKAFYDGVTTPLGTIGRPIRGGSVSDDLSRATLTEMDYRADAWSNKVVVH